MMRPVEAATRRRSRPRAQGPGARRACATPGSIAELWVPLVMMAVIGTLAFNFQTVLPLFAVRDLDGQRPHLLAPDVGGQRRLAARRPALGPRARTSSVRTREPRRRPAFGAAMLALAVAPNQPVAFADRRS